MDVDSIEPGLDFREVIAEAVGGCDVLLAIIGPNWLSAADFLGGRRLDDSDDLVRLEIEAVLAKGVRVIPVLIGESKNIAQIGVARQLGAVGESECHAPAAHLVPSRFFTPGRSY